MSMWEPFTEPGRRSIVRAQELAQEYGDAFIGHHHIFVALADDADVAEALSALGADRHRVAEAAENVLGEKSFTPVQEMVFTSEAKRMIELAFDNARKLNNNFIGPEHLALGYIALGPKYAQVIATLKIDADELHDLLVASLDKKPKHPERTASIAQSKHSLEDCFAWLGHRKVADLRPEALWDAVTGAAAEKNLGAALAYGFVLARLNGWSAGQTAQHILDEATKRFDN